MRFIFQSDRWRSKGIICRKAEITLRQQGKQERSARPRKHNGLPRAPLRRGAVTAKPVTERFNPDAVELCKTERAPKTFFKKS